MAAGTKPVNPLTYSDFKTKYRLCDLLTEVQLRVLDTYVERRDLIQRDWNRLSGAMDYLMEDVFEDDEAKKMFLDLVLQTCLLLMDFDSDNRERAAFNKQQRHKLFKAINERVAAAKLLKDYLEFLANHDTNNALLPRETALRHVTGLEEIDCLRLVTYLSIFERQQQELIDDRQPNEYLEVDSKLVTFLCTCIKLDNDSELPIESLEHVAEFLEFFQLESLGKDDDVRDLAERIRSRYSKSLNK